MEIFHNRKTLEANGVFTNIVWRLKNNIFLVILYIFLFILQTNCQTVKNESSQNSFENITKINNIIDKVDTKNHCHNCHSDNEFKKNKEDKTEEKESFIEELITTVNVFTEKYLLNNKTKQELEIKAEKLLDEALSKDKYEIMEGVEIKSIGNTENITLNNNYEIAEEKGRALFSKYTYEYRMYQKIKNFIDTHILSINIPKAANLFTSKSFGLKKLFVPLLIGAQVFKSILLAMFLPSILGSFGKILGKGISHLSATSSQASFPPANVDEQDAYNNENFMGYETDPAGNDAYPDGTALYTNMAEANGVNDLSNVDLSRFGAQKVSYLPSSNSYYKNQLAAGNNYKVFQRIPASSMILSNYDPFYSPLLSRLDGIFARLGLTPSENTIEGQVQVGGQTVNDVKLESCREQLICLMYASPAKYAPYSNLVSAQLSRELNELRRPVSDNPEILRFFRYMRAARRGQGGTDCIRAHPSCTAPATPAHTMIAAYHDINKLVTARKLSN